MRTEDFNSEIFAKALNQKVYAKLLEKTDEETVQNALLGQVCQLLLTYVSTMPELSLAEITGNKNLAADLDEYYRKLIAANRNNYEHEAFALLSDTNKSLVHAADLAELLHTGTYGRSDVELIENLFSLVNAPVALTLNALRPVIGTDDYIRNGQPNDPFSHFSIVLQELALTGPDTSLLEKLLPAVSIPVTDDYQKQVVSSWCEMFGKTPKFTDSTDSVSAEHIAWKFAYAGLRAAIKKGYTKKRSRFDQVFGPVVNTSDFTSLSFGNEQFNYPNGTEVLCSAAEQYCYLAEQVEDEEVQNAYLNPNLAAQLDAWRLTDVNNICSTELFRTNMPGEESMFYQCEISLLVLAFHHMLNVVKQTEPDGKLRFSDNDDMSNIISMMSKRNKQAVANLTDLAKIAKRKGLEQANNARSLNDFSLLTTEEQKAIVSAVETFASLKDDIEQLKAKGLLNDVQGRSMLTKLEGFSAEFSSVFDTVYNALTPIM